MKQQLILDVFLLLSFSCTQKQDIKSPNGFAPKVVESRGYPFPIDSVIEPEIIKAGKPIVTHVGKPKVISTNTNIHPAGIPKIVLAGITRIATPGQDGFSLPETVTAIERPFITGVPEVVIAKDPFVKDQNPQNFSSFRKLPGLNGSSILCSIEDNIGNLWFGMNGGGVTKYDGKSFAHFTEKEGLPNNTVGIIVQDKSGNLWFGTEGGVTRYDGKYFTNFTEKEGLLNDHIGSILQDKSGNLWFGSEGGVSKFNGKSFTHFTEKEGLYKNGLEGLANSIVTSILQDKGGNLWFGLDYNGGVSKYDGKSFTHFTDKEGLSNNSVSSILEDKLGNLWFGTGGGVSKYDGKSFTHFTDKEGLSNNSVSSILEDKSGNLWFGTGGGLSKYDGTSFTNYSEQEGLPNKSVFSILQDKSGNLWFATDGGGVAKYNGKLFTNFIQNIGLSKVVSILQDKSGNLWFGTFEGVVKFDGKSFTYFTEKEGLFNNPVVSILQDKSGNLWFGTVGGGVSKYDGKSFTYFTIKTGFINNVVICIEEDHSGNLWFGTNGGGAYKYDGKSFTHFTEKQGLSNNYVTRILQDKSGNLWFGTSGGVSKYDGKSFIHFTEKEGLSNNSVTSILQDKGGDLWFGTNGGGVSKYDGKSFTHFTEKQGLSDNSIFSVLQDKSGNLWFATVLGLSKLSKERLSEISETTKLQMLPNGRILFKNYTYEDGFLGTICLALYEDASGAIWIGTDDKLVVYHPEGEIADTIAPNIQLTAIELFNENIEWTNLEKRKDTVLTLGNGVLVSHFEFDSLTRWYGLPVNLNLAYNNNYLTFNFIGITQKSPRKVKYQFKLEGNDDKWSALSSSTQAPYGNLAPGTYNFKVKAMNSEGYWSDEFTYRFTIRPPWWRTWWAYILYALFAFGTFSVLYLNHIRQLKKKQADQIRAVISTQEEERKRISRDLHDDIGTKLSTLKLFLSSLNEKALDTSHEEIKSLAQSSEQFIKEVVKDVRQLLVNLSPSTLEEFGYTTAVEVLVNKINETHLINFDLTVFGLNQRLHKEYELSLYRITQELITNILKHAEAKHVSLQVGQRDGKIILMIEDDGKGFDINVQNNGYGLKNLNARTKLLNGSLNIESQKGKGTIVLIEIPYNLT